MSHSIIKQKNIVIVGATLAGLSAAYELAREGHKITILEKTEFLGGNIRSISIANFDENVDFGTQKIYNWSANVLDLAKQLNLTSQIQPVTSNVIVQPAADAMDQEYVKWQTLVDQVTNQDRIPLIIPLLDLVGLTPKKYLSIYNMDDGKYKTRSMDQLLTNASHVKHFVNTFLQSYSSGQLTETPAFLAVPFATRLAQSGELTFGGSTYKLIDALATELTTKLGGVILTSADAIDADDIAREIYYEQSDPLNPTALPELRKVKYDELIITSPLTSLTIGEQPIMTKIEDPNLVPLTSADDVPSFRYTSHATVCIRVDAIPVYDFATNWTECLQTADNTADLQIRRITNLEQTDNLPNHLLLNIVAKSQTVLEQTFDPTITTDAQRQTIIQTLMDNTRLFQAPNNTQLVEIIHVEIFRRTTAVINTAAWQRLQYLNGRRHIWFAGQYTGPFPCLETACYQGRKVAFRIIHRKASRAFHKWIQRIDHRQIDWGRLTFAAKYILFETAGAMALSVAAWTLLQNMFPESFKHILIKSPPPNFLTHEQLFTISQEHCPLYLQVNDDEQHDQGDSSDNEDDCINLECAGDTLCISN